MGVLLSVCGMRRVSVTCDSKDDLVIVFRLERIKDAYYPTISPVQGI